MHPPGPGEWGLCKEAQWMEVICADGLPGNLHTQGGWGETDERPRHPENDPEVTLKTGGLTEGSLKLGHQEQSV